MFCAIAIGWKSAEKGAATSLYVATHPGLNTQQCHYYVDCRVKQSSALSRYEREGEGGGEGEGEEGSGRKRERECVFIDDTQAVGGVIL